MPANTGSPYFLPYPLATEPPDGPAQLQSLANQVGSSITTKANETSASATSYTDGKVTTINNTTNSLQSQITVLNNLNISSRLTTLETLTSDTGWQSAMSANGSGWSVTLHRYRTFGGKVTFLEVDSVRTGAAISADAQGNMSDSVVGTLFSAALPFATWYGIYDGADMSGAFSVQTSNGQLIVRDGHPNSDIDTNDNCRFRACYVKVS